MTLFIVSTFLEQKNLFFIEKNDFNHEIKHLTSNKNFLYIIFIGNFTK